MESDFDAEDAREVIGEPVGRRDVGVADEIGVGASERGEFGGGMALVGGVEEKQQRNGAGDDEKEKRRGDAEPKV